MTRRERPDPRAASPGFSLVELLVATAICALLSAAIAAVTPGARAAFDTTPDILDLQQRERTAVHVLAVAVHSALHLAATTSDGAAGTVVPAVELLDPAEEGDWFGSVRVMAAAGPGRGVLAADQSSESGPLRLQPHCPSTGDVCGFSRGALVAVVDVAGRFDLFTVASAHPGARSLTPSRALSTIYPAGSAVFDVSADAYYLQTQPDASFTLVRETAAGAVQPIVEDVAELRFAPWRLAGTLRRVDIVVRVVGRSPDRHRRIASRTRHLTVALRNPS